MTTKWPFLGAAFATAILLAPASAQVTIGASSGASTEAEAIANVDWLSQTFVAPASYMTGLSFWYNGGSFYHGDAQLSRLRIGTGGVPGGGIGPSDLYTAELHQGVRGRYDFRFDYLQMVAGEVYTFSVLTVNCGGYAIGGLDPCGLGEKAQSYGGADVAPSLEVTTSDAYAFGEAYLGRSGARLDRDVRFEASFAQAVVPEPSTWALLLIGCVGMMWIGLRRRGTVTV